MIDRYKRTKEFIKKPDYEGVVFVCKIPPPAFINELKKQFIDSAEFDAVSGNISIKYNEASNIFIEKQWLGCIWSARGEGINYKRRFGLFSKSNIVIADVASDLANMSITVEQVVDHIMKHNIEKPEIMALKVGARGKNEVIDMSYYNL